MNADELEGLIQDVLDGRADDVAQEVLKRELEASADARKIYLDYVYLSIAMGFSEAEAKDANIVPMDLIIARQKRRSQMVAGLCAAAALVVALIVSAYLVLPQPPIARFVCSVDTEFTLTHPAHKGSAPEGQVLEAGSRLQVARGTIELNFGSGVRGIVRAPADLTLHSEDRVDLAHGVAWFSVSPKEVGFQVDTPDFLLTDLGTEFGVVSELEALDEVHVFTGEVEVVHHRGDRAKKSLVAGQARRADDEGNWQEIVCRPERFLSDLPDKYLPPYLRFRFDSEENGELKVEGTHWDVSKIVARFVSGDGEESAAPTFAPGVDGQALQLDGEGEYVQTNWRGISGKRLRTVTCWVRIAEDVDLTTLPAIVGWGRPSSTMGAKWKILASNAHKGGAAVARVSFGTEWFEGQTAINDGRWHHLAVVYYARALADGTPAVAIYVDGRQEQLSYLGGDQSRGSLNEVNTDTRSAGALPMMIGKGLRSMSDALEGAIDDLYIYEGVLSEDVIRASAEAGREQKSILHN